MTIEELPSPSRCPNCGTWLQGEATTCPTCGRDRGPPVADVPGRAVSSQPLIVGAGAAALVAVGILIGWTIDAPTGWGPSPSPASPSPSPASPSARPTSTPEPSDPKDGSYEAGGIKFSLRVGAGWESFGSDYPNYITKDVAGSQGAEALIYWTTLRPDVAEACYYLQTQQTGPSAADLAAVMAAVPGIDLITGPSEVTLGGLSAYHVALTVREDVGCDPGFFFTYPSVYGGALWPETVPGDIIRVWIIDVPDLLVPNLLVIVGGTHPEAGADLEQEAVEIVQSIRLE